MELMKELYCTSARPIKRKGPDECDGFFGRATSKENIKTEKIILMKWKK